MPAFGLLVSHAETLARAPARLTDWLDENGSELGRRHAAQVKRHHQR